MAVTPFISLRDLNSGSPSSFTRSPVRLGRAPNCELTVTGDGSSVVSACHAILAYHQGQWQLNDAGSRNGTYYNQRRLSEGETVPVSIGDTIALGGSGPRFQIEATEQAAVAATVVDMERYDPSTEVTAPVVVPPIVAAQHQQVNQPAATTPATVEIVLRETKGGERHRANAGRIRIGRGDECELRPLGLTEAVSRVHAEIVLKPDGSAAVRDARSRNGTLINGTVITGDHRLKKGDKIRLGSEGPELTVEFLTVSGRVAKPAAPVRAPAAPAVPVAAAPPAPRRRSFGGKGATGFFRDVIETNQKSAARLRWVLWSLVAVIVAAVGGVYWYGENRVQATVAALEQQRLEIDQQRRAIDLQRQVADSVRTAAQADYDRLRGELEVARNSSAAVTVVDSLRLALAAASRRTEALEASLKRAESTISEQLASRDSLRRRAEADLVRLRSDLDRAASSQVPQALIDSLRGKVQDAERRASGIEAQVRAVRGANLASVAQVNQGAVGLVTAFEGDEIFDGSGFVLTASGYFVTNRHVVRPENLDSDSMFVTMADQQFMARATVVAVAPADGPDLAVLKIHSYKGPHIARLDWTNENARQGEPAALIGFPAGVAAALDQTRTVRTSMSAGIFSKITDNLVQFDGFTVGGSSGSPVFNANGEVVAVHRSGLKEASGLGFAVPVALLIPLLPDEARAELGLR